MTTITFNLRLDLGWILQIITNGTERCTNLHYFNVDRDNAHSLHRTFSAEELRRIEKYFIGKSVTEIRAVLNHIDETWHKIEYELPGFFSRGEIAWQELKNLIYGQTEVRVPIEIDGSALATLLEV